MKEQNQDDQVLLDKFAKTNDQIWLLRLFQKYDHLIYGICLKHSKDADYSKDLKTQIYEKLVVKAKALQTNNFKNWLYTLCKNHCIDELRKKSRKTSSLDKYRKLQIEQEDHVYFSHEERLIIEEDQHRINTAMEKATKSLSIQQQTCMKLFYQQRLSYLEISQETGMERNLVKSHLQNGKRSIKRYIFKHYNF